ncbi:MAG: GNAT family N-acetyltransferase [Candidatus Brevundimonas phytovorans]|nr:GNAT family N-acetyltransferase [Brevundimonas sp.]WEK58717.1 MAG: GNAT family N-acetyltransferase [Brevundimonas sp.]
MPGVLTIEICDLDSLGAEACAQWNAWSMADPDLASPYFRVEFAQIAARISPACAVAIFKRDGVVVGYFPHQRRGGAVLPVAAPMNDYHGVIGPRGERPTLAEAARLLGGARFSVNGWVGEAPGAAVSDSFRTTIPNEGGYDAWYAARRRAFGKYFKDKERARRSMETEFGAVEVQIGLRDEALLDELIVLKRDQYRRTGRHDVFACGWTRDLLHALMAHEQDDFGASIAVLRAGGRIAAMEYSLHAGRRFHFWFPVYVPSLARCSPGIMLSMETIRLGAERGYRDFDYGFGGETYKRYFCDTVQPVAEAVILKPGLSSTLGEAGAALLAMAGGARLVDSVRRRWNVIEACETSAAGRLKGAGLAARAALSKAAGRAGAAA